MRQLDPGAVLLGREPDLDQLLLAGRQLDDPGKGEPMRRIVRQHGAPGGFAPVLRALENAAADPRLDSAVHRVGAGMDPRQRPPAREILGKQRERAVR
jgi:hypothetical protein